jgi:hypothetical protein
MSKRVVHCRLCDFTCPVWWANKKGESRNGMERLRKHFIDDHFDEYVKIEKQLSDDIFTKTRGT